MATSLKSLFLELQESGSPAPQELLQLRALLDHECLQHSSGRKLLFQPTDYTPDLIKRTALYLSGPLNQVESFESSVYRIHQLRALIAALALLHHLEVDKLYLEPYNLLRHNLANRFSDIVDGRRQSQTTSIETARYFTALFLVRLAAQYFSFFKRRGPTAEVLFVPVLGLALTGASIVSHTVPWASRYAYELQASGQYNNLHNVFTWIDQIIAEIPRHQNKNVTLPGLQEITRNTISAHLYYESSTGTSILTEAADLLQEALETRLDDAPRSPNNQWDRTRSFVRRVPELNTWYFMYGLLDCAIQLAQAFGPSRVPSGLRRALQRLAYTSTEEHFRWKAVGRRMGGVGDGATADHRAD